MTSSQEQRLRKQQQQEKTPTNQQTRNTLSLCDALDTWFCPNGGMANLELKGKSDHRAPSGGEADPLQFMACVHDPVGGNRDISGF